MSGWTFILWQSCCLPHRTGTMCAPDKMYAVATLCHPLIVTDSTEL